MKIGAFLYGDAYASNSNPHCAVGTALPALGECSDAVRCIGCAFGRIRCNRTAAPAVHLGCMRNALRVAFAHLESGKARSLSHGQKRAHSSQLHSQSRLLLPCSVTECITHRLELSYDTTPPSRHRLDCTWSAFPQMHFPLSQYILLNCM